MRRLFSGLFTCLYCKAPCLYFVLGCKAIPEVVSLSANVLFSFSLGQLRSKIPQFMAINSYPELLQ